MFCFGCNNFINVVSFAMIVPRSSLSVLNHVSRFLTSRTGRSIERFVGVRHFFPDARVVNTVLRSRGAIIDRFSSTRGTRLFFRSNRKRYRLRWASSQWNLNNAVLLSRERWLETRRYFTTTSGIPGYPRDEFSLPSFSFNWTGCKVYAPLDRVWLILFHETS